MTADRLLRLREAANQTGMGESTIVQRVRKGTFPAPVRNGRSIRWRLSDLVKFIEALPTTREERNA